jgi:DNA-binding response OmpR family regulator
VLIRRIDLLLGKERRSMAIVVLIDGDPLQARLIVDNLGTVGHVVLWARQSWDGLLLTHQVRPDLLIIDSAVPQCFEMLTMLRTMRGLSRLPLLMIANRRPPSYYVKKLALAACIDRHFDAETLVQQVQQLVQPSLLMLPRSSRVSPCSLGEPSTTESAIPPH